MNIVHFGLFIPLFIAINIFGAINSNFSGNNRIVDGNDQSDESFLITMFILSSIPNVKMHLLNSLYPPFEKNINDKRNFNSKESSNDNMNCEFRDNKSINCALRNLFLNRKIKKNYNRNDNEKLKKRITFGDPNIPKFNTKYMKEACKSKSLSILNCSRGNDDLMMAYIKESLKSHFISISEFNPQRIIEALLSNNEKLKELFGMKRLKLKYNLYGSKMNENSNSNQKERQGHRRIKLVQKFISKSPILNLEIPNLESLVPPVTIQSLINDCDLKIIKNDSRKEESIKNYGKSNIHDIGIVSAFNSPHPNLIINLRRMNKKKNENEKKSDNYNNNQNESENSFNLENIEQTIFISPNCIIEREELVSKNNNSNNSNNLDSIIYDLHAIIFKQNEKIENENEKYYNQKKFNYNSFILQDNKKWLLLKINQGKIEIQKNRERNELTYLEYPILLFYQQRSNAKMLSNSNSSLSNISLLNSLSNSNPSLSLLSGNGKRKMISGLINPDATACYVNSTIQLFQHCPDFVNAVKDLMKSSNRNHQIDCLFKNDKSSVACALFIHTINSSLELSSWSASLTREILDKKTFLRIKNSCLKRYGGNERNPKACSTIRNLMNFHLKKAFEESVKLPINDDQGGMKYTVNRGQADASEFLTFILSNLEKYESIIKLFSFKLARSMKHEFNVNSSLSDSLVSKIPFTDLKSDLNAIFKSPCHDNTIVEERENNYHLALAVNSLSIQNSLKKEIDLEYIEKKCEKCENRIKNKMENIEKLEIIENEPKYKMESRFSSRILWMNYPKILVIQLKRFEMDWSFDPPITKKNNENIIIEDYVYLFNHYSTKGEECRYMLTGFSTHIGHTLTSGHYVSYFKLSDGNWYEYNDDKIRIMKNGIRDYMGTPYILTFIKM